MAKRTDRDTFTFQVSDGNLERLDKLRSREGNPPSRGLMLNRLIERALEELEQREASPASVRDPAVPTAVEPPPPTTTRPKRRQALGVSGALASIIRDRVS